MNKTTILFAGFADNAAGMVERFDNSWIITVADTAETAIEKFQQFHYDVVITGKNFDETTLQKLKKLFSSQQPDILFVQEGENDPEPAVILSGLEAKRKQSKPAISFTDDGLKNAGLNIQIQ